MTPGPPSADEQITFLRNVQRILSEGNFVATYKYALLHALADLAVLEGDDSGNPLRLSSDRIAERFVELYWHQATSFRGKGRLRQNTGSPAAILNRIEEARLDSRGSLARLRRDERAWRRLVKSVARTVRVMPLWKLQTIGGVSHAFLYDSDQRGTEIELRAGVAFCLRSYHSLLVDLIRSAWLRYVRRHNAQLLGETSDLYGFLFGRERDPRLMSRCGPLLRDVQQGVCLYCQKGIRKEGQVDHFVPWALYPVDLGHNLVLAHGRCNNDKSDRLAAEDHLEAWLVRSHECGVELENGFDEADVLHDRAATERIAGWAYVQSAASSGLVWKRGNELAPLSGRWSELLTGTATRYPASDGMGGAALAAERPA